MDLYEPSKVVGAADGSARAFPTALTVDEAGVWTLYLIGSP